MELTTKRGAKVFINEADFRTAMQLKNAMQKACQVEGISIAGLLSAEKLADVLPNLPNLDSDERVQLCVMEALKTSVYNGQKIDDVLFSDDGAREDYYEIFAACLKANLLPFFKSLVFEFSRLLQNSEQTENLDTKSGTN